MDPFIGEIRYFPWSFAPQGWHLCDGTLLTINQYQALFALLGNRYGGDGRVNFALPDLRGRVPVCQTVMPQPVQYVIGKTGGAEAVVVASAMLPSHTHALNAAAIAADASGGSEEFPGEPVPNSGAVLPIYSTDTAPGVPLIAAAVSVAGASVGHNNMQPFLVLNPCIAMTGIWPQRQ